MRSDSRARFTATPVFAVLNTSKREPKRRSNGGSCLSSTNKHEEGFMRLWVEYEWVHYPVGARSKKGSVFLPKHLGHSEAAPPRLRSDTDTLTSAVLDAELLLPSCRLRAASGGHTMATKLRTLMPSLQKNKEKKRKHTKANSKPCFLLLRCNWKPWRGLKIIHLLHPVWPFFLVWIQFLEIMSRS